MKFLIFILFAYNYSFAYSTKCRAMVRDSRHNLVVKDVFIKNLKSKTSFDGLYIKVVKRTSSVAVSFDSNDSLRACTAYYHLSKARSYFKQNFNPEALKKRRALVARIEMDLGFEESTHFKHKNNGLFYNNAITIPPSDRSRIAKKPWYFEIWFAPKKKVKIDNSTYKATKLVTSWPFMSNLLLGVGQSQATTIGVDLVRGSSFSSSYYFETLGLSIGVTAMVPNIIKWTSRPFKQTLYLDTGMIPEVIYHEYTHFALSSLLSMERHAPVVDGVANYYAAMIGKTDSILKKTKGYSKGLVELSASGKKKYKYTYEDRKYAQSDFTFKFLYGLKEIIGEEKMSRLLYDSLSIIKKSDDLSIKPGLTQALLNSLSDGSYSKSTKYKFLAHLQNFGI